MQASNDLLRVRHHATIKDILSQGPLLITAIPAEVLQFLIDSAAELWVRPIVHGGSLVVASRVGKLWLHKSADGAAHGIGANAAWASARSATRSLQL